MTNHQCKLWGRRNASAAVQENKVTQTGSANPAGVFLLTNLKIGHKIPYQDKPPTKTNHVDAMALTFPDGIGCSKSGQLLERICYLIKKDKRQH